MSTYAQPRRRYAVVLRTIWQDIKFRQLPPDGKLVFLYLLTCPDMTSLGAMRGCVKSVGLEMEPPADEREWVADGFEKVLESGMALHDPHARLIVLPNYMRHNPPANPNCIIHFGVALDMLPECDLLDEHILRVALFVRGLGKPELYAALPQRMKDASPMPKQDDFGGGYDSGEPETFPDFVESMRIVEEEWNGYAIKGGLRTMIKWTAKRMAALRERLKDEWWRNNWQAAMKIASESPKMTGKESFKDGGTYHATLDWFLRDGTVGALMEGVHDERDKGQRGQATAASYQPNESSPWGGD